jgi:serine/threonine-protein kinase
MTVCPNCGGEIAEGFKFCPQCGTMTPSVPTPESSLVGRTLNGKYRIVNRVGGGSMGVVYEAEHTGLMKRVAVKVLHTDLQVGEETVRRFQQEGVAAGRFHHPNAIQIFDFDRTEDGIFYLAMEFVKGESLKARIVERGALPPEAAVRIIRQVLGVLAEAHAQGIVHRDLKPDNIMVSPTGEGEESVKVLDFGISKLLDAKRGEATKTQTGRILGTPLYMAPEQCSGAAVDHRCDLYAAGLILHEMIAGRPPFHGETVNEILYKHTTEDPPPLGANSPGATLPGGIEELLRRALAKKREERFSSAREMIDALDALDFERDDRPRRPRRRPAASGGGRRRKVLAAAVVATVLLAFAAILTRPLWTGGGAGDTEGVRVSRKAPDLRTEDERRYVETLDDARRRIRARDPRGALDAAAAAIAMPCRDEEAYVVRGRAFLLGDDLDPAAADFREALQQDPGYAEARCGLGWVALERGDVDEAEASFDLALEADAECAEAWAGRGVALLRARRMDEAEKALRRAVEIAPSLAVAHHHLGRLLAERGDDPAAIDALVEAKRHDPKLVGAYLDLGEAYARNGDLEQAAKQYRDALLADPESLTGRRSLATILVEQRRLADAEALLREAVRSHPEAGRCHILLGLIQHAQERYDEAIASLERGIPLSPDEAGAMHLLGILYHEKGRPDDALVQYRSALAIDPANPEILESLGLALFSLDRWEEAEAALSEAAAEDPESATVHLALASLYRDAYADDERAAEHLRRFLELGGANAEAEEWLRGR